MTDKTQDWRTMTAGRELDEEIAARLGWHTEVTSNNRRVWVDAQGYERALPDWSSNTDAALTLLPPPPNVVMICRIESENIWHCSINSIASRLREMGDGEGGTITLAICRAWLSCYERQPKDPKSVNPPSWMATQLSGE